MQQLLEGLRGGLNAPVFRIAGTQLPEPPQGTKPPAPCHSIDRVPLVRPTRQRRRALRRLQETGSPSLIILLFARWQRG